jgi:zinc protease
VSEAMQLVREEMTRMGQGPVQERELQLAKSFLIGSFPLRLDTSRKVADLLVSMEEYGLGLDYPERFTREIAKVSAADVQRVAARYMDPPTFSSVTVGK